MQGTSITIFKNVLITCFLFISVSVPAQNVDSLKKELPRARTDKQKLSLTYLVGDIYSRTDNTLDSSWLYLNRAVQLGTAVHDDSIVMESEGRLGIVTDAMNRFPESYAHWDKAILMAKVADNARRQMDFLIKESQLSGELEHYTISIEESNAALALAIHLRDKSTEASIYNSIAAANVYSNKYDVALDVVGRSIKIQDSLKNYIGSAEDYELITEIFGKQKKYKEALKYGLIMDSIYAKTGLDDISRNMGKVNLAIIYKNVGECDKAIGLYHEALKFFANNPYCKMFVYTNLGIALSAKGAFAEAQKCFLLCNQINSSAFQISGIEFGNYKEMANTFLKSHQLDSALYYGKLSEKSIGKKGIRPDEYKECIKLLAGIYAARGDIKNAQAYYGKYGEMQDSIFADRQDKNIAEQETRLKLSEKNKQLSLLAKENELNKIKEQRQAIALVLGALIVVVIIVAYRRAIKKNALLAEQKKIIDVQVVQLEAAATMKSKFLANISHELRTPVTLLTGMLEMVKNKAEKKEPVDAEKVAMAFNNSQKLQYMIEEILDLSRVEGKAARVSSKVKEASPLLKRIVYAFETFIDKKGMQLVYSDTNANGIYIATDEDKFEKIINNLVYNAVKFNRTGGTISVDARLTAGNRLQITVSDTGSGIKADDLPYIFERFYQGASGNKAKSEGVGIGLSLVKEFTLLLGGSINVASTPCEGTVFTLQFAVAEKEAGEQETEPIPMPEIVWAHFEDRNTVLIAEDNIEMRYYLREILGDKVNIAEARNGREALEWMKLHNPDLIITDMMMPEMDGREFITHIKAVETYSKIPVITLTALADVENQLSMLQLGVDDYIVKPFNAEELRIRVYNLLKNSKAREQFNEGPHEPDDVKPDSKEAEGFRNKIYAYVSVRLKNEDISVYELALELALSERQLYRLAKSLTGCTPAQLIKEVRLQKAYELLTTGKVYKIEDLARRVGFENTSYFSRQFLERFGKRPAEFL